MMRLTTKTMMDGEAPGGGHITVISGYHPGQCGGPGTGRECVGVCTGVSVLACVAMEPGTERC